MDAEIRKKKAQQARTQLTIGFWMRLSLITGSIAAAFIAAGAALMGYETVDITASVVVISLLIVEAVVYGFGHADRILRQRAKYTQVIHEIEAGQYSVDKTLLRMPTSYPHVEALSYHINRLRWLPKPWSMLADVLVAIVIITMISFSIYCLITLGINVSGFVEKFHMKQ